MVQKTKTSATTTVMRSRFFSTTVEPIAADAHAAAEHVGQTATLAAVEQHEEDHHQGGGDVGDGDEGDEHGLAGYQPRSAAATCAV